MIETPKRLQRRRVKGWKKPENSLYVGRGSKWGNPFRVGTDAPMWREPLDNEGAVGLFKAMLADEELRAAANYPSAEEIRRELRGKNLLCWCGENERFCHADVLIEIANEEN